MIVLILALMEHPEQSTQVKVQLEHAGYEVHIVDTFVRAKGILEEHTFDLIISDVHLENGGSVFDFLKWVRNHPEFELIPFVLLSLEPGPMAKYLADGVRTAARQLGANKYIAMDDLDCDVLLKEISEFPSRAIEASQNPASTPKQY